MKIERTQYNTLCTDFANNTQNQQNNANIQTAGAVKYQKRRTCYTAECCPSANLLTEVESIAGHNDKGGWDTNYHIQDRIITIVPDGIN